MDFKKIWEGTKEVAKKTVEVTGKTSDLLEGIAKKSKDVYKHPEKLFNPIDTTRWVVKGIKKTIDIFK